MNSSRRALITGAGGFVCSHIARVLLEQGWQVVAVDRQFDEAPQQKLQAQWGDQISFVQTDSVSLPDITVDGLIHGAAITALPEDLGQTPEANYRSNMEPLLSVSEWASQHQVKRSLYISSSAVYAEISMGVVDESIPTSPSGLYGVVKQATEALISTLREVYNRDVTTIRLSNIYGLGEQSRPTRPRINLAGQMVQEAVQTGHLTVYHDDPARDWTFALDVGTAVAALLDQPKLNHALYNVASEQMVSPLEIATVMKSLMPDLSLDIRNGTNPNVPPLTRRGYLSNQRLEKETGFTGWTTFKDGLQKVLAEQHKQDVPR